MFVVGIFFYDNQRKFITKERFGNNFITIKKYLIDYLA